MRNEKCSFYKQRKYCLMGKKSNCKILMKRKIRKKNLLECERKINDSFFFCYLKFDKKMTKNILKNISNFEIIFVN